MPALKRAMAVCLLLLGASGTSFGQGRGDYLNVESPQVSPIALLTVNGQTVIITVNTPDNCVELWSTNEALSPANRFIQRLWVGLEPVSIAIDPATGEFWTANFLSDSVTHGIVEPSGSSVRARVLFSRNLGDVITTTFDANAAFGDEPMDVAFFTHVSGPTTTRTIFVTLNTTSAVMWLNADTLLPFQAPAVLDFKSTPLVQNTGKPPLGLKEPRAVRVSGGRVFALGSKGGVTDPQSLHDLDVLSGAAVTPLQFDQSIPPALGKKGLGTTNYNMRFASNGDLFVVGGEARNFVTDNKEQVRSSPPFAATKTGFVTSHVYRVQTPASVNQTIFARDLNANGSGTVAKVDAASQPTDIALLESGGVVNKVFIASFGTDRIIVLDRGTSGSADIGTWTRSKIDLNVALPSGGYSRFGPRGLVLGTGTSGQRLFVHCRLANCIVSIDPVTLAKIVLPLKADPTPDYVRRGRQFLYSGDQSATGFVSCASCHVDGRTDALAWRLGRPIQQNAPLDPAGVDPDQLLRLAGTGTFPQLAAGNPSDPDFHIMMLAFGTFDPVGADDKREMVTQSLQGLLNFEVDLPSKEFVTNAPFHWRGDKKSVRDFNEAFVTLLLGTNVGTAQDPRGLTESQMDDFERFVHSIHYPPNPKEPVTRRYASVTDSTGVVFDTQREFYERPTILNNRSCSHCHEGADGSNNRATVLVTDLAIPGFVAQTNRQPIESAALRGLFQKEPLLEHDGTFLQKRFSTPRVGHFGLNHNGVQPVTGPFDPNSAAERNLTTINTFVDTFFGGANGLGPAIAAKHFVHQFDWGVGPAVGSTACFTPTVIANPAEFNNQIGKVITALTAAGDGNSSIVAWLVRPTQATASQRQRGFRFDPIQSLWIEEPMTNPPTAIPLSGLLPLVTAPTDSLTVVSTPLGNERRCANGGGNESAVPTAFAPTSVELEGFVTNTANASVPTFVKNWSPAGAPGAPAGLPASDFLAFLKPPATLQPLLGFPGFPGGKPVDEVFAKTIRLYQYGLLNGQNAISYGVPFLRHEAPRRIQVSGSNIQPGAKLLFSIPDPTTLPPPVTPRVSALNEAAGSGPVIARSTIELPLYATGKRHPITNLPLFETAVEFDSLAAYQIMLGGKKAPGVDQTVVEIIINEYIGLPTGIVEPTTGTPPFALPYAPDDWNWNKIEIRNPKPTPATPDFVVTSAPIWRQIIMR